MSRFVSFFFDKMSEPGFAMATAMRSIFCFVRDTMGAEAALAIAKAAAETSGELLVISSRMEGAPASGEQEQARVDAAVAALRTGACTAAEALNAQNQWRDAVANATHPPGRA